MSRYEKSPKSPLLHSFSVGDQVFVSGTRGIDPKPCRISKLLPDLAYELSRDGVCDNKVYGEENLTSARDLGWKYNETNAKKDPQDSVDNVAVVARSSAMPTKEVEVNTANNDSLPHHALNRHISWHSEAVIAPDKPYPNEPHLDEPHLDDLDLEVIEWNPPLHIPSLSFLLSSPTGRGQVASEVAPTVSHINDSEGRLGEVKVENIAEEQVENPLLKDKKATELSDRREVAVREGYTSEMFHIRQKAFEDSAYGTASHGQSSGVKGVLPAKSDAVERQIDDSCTEYSNISMTESGSETYMECFADDLYAVASKIRCDPQSIQTLSALLPELLQQFALKIGQEVSYKDGREVMFYVYKHRM